MSSNPDKPSPPSFFDLLATDVRRCLQETGQPMTLSDIWDKVQETRACSADQLRAAVENAVRAGHVAAGDKDPRGRVFYRATEDASGQPSKPLAAKPAIPDAAKPRRERASNSTAISAEPAQLLSLAEAAPARTATLVAARAYLPAVNTLRGKGYSWKDCSRWLEENGVMIKWGTLAKAAQIAKTATS